MGNFNSAAEFIIVNEDFRDLPNTFLACEKPGVKAGTFELKFNRRKGYLS
jgi:hypothetical protein